MMYFKELISFCQEKASRKIGIVDKVLTDGYKNSCILSRQMGFKSKSSLSIMPTIGFIT